MPIIDPQALERMIDGDEELLADISIMFARELPEIGARLRYSIENRETEIIENTAHQLRGRVGYFGATELQGVARKLEEAARNNNLKELPSLSNEILEGIHQMMDELRELTGLALEIDDQ